METELKIGQTTLNLDDLFRMLGECDYLYMKTQTYLDSLREERSLIIKAIEEIYNGQQDDSKNMGNTNEL